MIAGGGFSRERFFICRAAEAPSGGRQHGGAAFKTMKNQHTSMTGLAGNGRDMSAAPTVYTIPEAEEGDFPPPDEALARLADAEFSDVLSEDLESEPFRLHVLAPDEMPSAVSCLKIGPYRVKVGQTSIGIIEKRQNRHTGEEYEAVVPLSDFFGCIETQIAIHRTGLDVPEILYLVGGRNAEGELPKVRVPAAKFAALEWVAAAWGTRAQRQTTSRLQDKILGYAIERVNRPMSLDIYEELGWREINAAWVYLHAGGGIGPDGRFVCAVEPGQRLAQAILPEPNPAADVVGLVSGLEAMAPPEVTWPLIAAAFRAPLLRWAPQCDSIFLLGRSGSRKTALATVFQQLFGAGFGGGRTVARPPASFCDTTKSILRGAHTAGGMIFLADDYAPPANERAAAQQRAGAEELFRAAANRSPRGRLTVNSSPMPDYYPRGLLIVTGEDINWSESIAARLFIVEVDRHSVRLPALTRMQEAASGGSLAAMMSEYIEWLARRQKAEGEPSRVEIDGPPRAAEMVGNLVWGAENLFAWMLARGCSEADVARLRERCRRALIQAAERSSRETPDPSEHFLELLRQALLMGRARFSTVGANLDEDDSVPIVGYRNVERSKVWVLPVASLAVVKRLGEESGKPYTLSDRGTGRRLDEANRLTTKDETRGTRTIRKSFNGSDVSVWEISPAAFSSEMPPGRGG